MSPLLLSSQILKNSLRKIRKVVVGVLSGSSISSVDILEEQGNPDNSDISITLGTLNLGLTETTKSRW